MNAFLSPGFCHDTARQKRYGIYLNFDFHDITTDFLYLSSGTD
jgi:hypothetical protein